MAKTNGTKGEGTNGNGGAALALVDEAALAAQLDGLELETDGLEEIDNTDVKIAARVLNFKGTDAAGEPIPTNQFYDTVTETASKEIDAVLLTVTKSNEWREYDEAEGKSKIRCRSFDRVTGVMEDGTSRPCKGCPDAEWRNVNGKRTRNCGPVANLIGLDRVSGSAFVLRCKKTAMNPWQTYLNKHFLGRRVVGSHRGNWPLFAFATKVSARMSDDKKYAIPVFERGEQLDAPTIQAMAATAKFYRDVVAPILNRLAENDADASDAATAPRPAASGSGDEFRDDFADAPAGGNRF